MAKEKGYIKLYRSILDWGWYADRDTRDVFLHLLLTVNYADKSYRGTVIKRGSRVVSLRKLSAEIGVTERSLRTALTRLENDSVLTRSKVGKTLCISIKNFDFYQSSDTETTQKQQQTDTEPVTDLPTTKEIKNKEYINKVEIKEKNIKKENFVIPSEIAEAFEGFAEMRQKIKKPLTDRAKKMALNKLQELAPNDYPMQIQILDQSTMQCWRGLFELQEKSQNGGGRYGQASGTADKHMDRDRAALEKMSVNVV